MTANGKLPDYLLIVDEAERWHLTDRNGALLLENVVNRDTLIALLKQARANFQIINPNEYIETEKGNS